MSDAEELTDGALITDDMVRDALAHLYDSAYLRNHPLLPLLIHRHMPDPLARAQALRTLIIETIRELRPQAPVLPQDREWRPYGILVLRYLDGVGDDKIERDLSISERQFFRDLKAGVSLLTSALASRASPPQPSQTSVLDDSLNGIGLQFERLDLNLLSTELLPLLQELANAHGRCVHAHLAPAPAVVVADAALSRPALISALSFLLRHSVGDVLLEVVPSSPQQALFLRAMAPPSSEPMATEDEAHLRTLRLMEQQGGGVAGPSPVSGDLTMGLYWPRFEEPPIVLVDDNPGMLRLYSRYLSGHGYRVIETAESSTALGIAKEQRARLVVLDVMMRGLDGWAVLKQIREDPVTRDVPVLVCSVINEPELAKALGATTLLKKPVSREQLLNAVAEIVGI